MILIHQKLNLNFYLKNSLCKNKEIINVLKKIIDEGFFEETKRHYLRKNTEIGTWAFDCRIPLLNSNNTRILFPYISQYLSDLGHTTLGLRGFGAFPFTSLSQYNNIQKIILIRKEQKSYGFQQEIEGALPHDIQLIDYKDQNDFQNLAYVGEQGKLFSKYKKICIIDDICNTGNSMMEAEHILYKNNYVTSMYFCLFNYSWGIKKIKTEKLDYLIEVIKN